MRATLTDVEYSDRLQRGEQGGVDDPIRVKGVALEGFPAAYCEEFHAGEKLFGIEWRGELQLAQVLRRIFQPAAGGAAPGRSTIPPLPSGTKNGRRVVSRSRARATA